MTDNEILLLFLVMLYLLEQNRRLNLHRLLSHSFLLERMCIFEIQGVAVQHLYLYIDITLYIYIYIYIFICILEYILEYIYIYYQSFSAIINWIRI